jgi:CHASE2 domain-containing sensor protein
MTKQGEITTKKPGDGLLWVGLVIAVVGLLLCVAAAISGGMPGVLSVSAVLVGAVLAVVGFARRLLAAVERN